VWNPFKKSASDFLGIDIGTYSIKVVELSKRGDRIKLENYGEAKAETLYEKPFRTIDKNTLLFSSQDIARALLAIFEEAKIAQREVVFSIPDFATFFIDFQLPPMTGLELPEAIKYEAKQYIPMPLSEVVMDWSVVEGEMGKGNKKGTALKILSVVVPLEFVNQYQEIAMLAGLKLKALEAEAFALLRALAGNAKGTFCIIDIGAQSTNVNIADNGILRKSHSFDVSGNEFTKIISNSLNIDAKEAEVLKIEKGISDVAGSANEILLPLVNHIISEASGIMKSFSQSSGKEVQKVILSGSSANLLGLKEYFANVLKKEVVAGNPFANVFYPPILEEKIKKVGPSYSVAAGAALRGLYL
jgi:type IV pilus assembly protein PilM